MTKPEHSEKRVAVTGMGLICAAGEGPDALWRGLTGGKSLIRELRSLDTTGMPVRSGGEVDDALLITVAGENAVKRTDRAILFGLVSARRALEDAALAEAVRNGLRAGLIVGSGMGPCQTLADSYAAYIGRGWQALRPTTVPRSMYNVIASTISMDCHLTGGHHVVASACASGAVAIADAFDWIRAGREKVVLAGGCDSPLIPSMFGAWINLRVLSRNPNAEKACRPFDKNRDGLTLAEGGAMLVLEEMEHARARGARIYAELLGAGTSSDTTHITQPSAPGQAAAIRQCLERSGIRPEDVDYINAHGTSTSLNDVTETQAVKLALGEEIARRVPISSSKSVIGHAMGASGALELCATILAVRNQTLPPTVNLETPDPACDLDYVPTVPRPARIRTALSNSFAFGGSNAVLAIREYEE